MATAMAVVLVGGLSLTQLQDTVHRYDVAPVSTGDVITSVPGVDVKNTPTYIPVPGTTEDIAPAYIQAVEERNEAGAIGRVEKTASDPLSDWRRNQSDRVEREKSGSKKEAATKSDDVLRQVDKNVSPVKSNAEPLHRWRRLQDNDQTPAPASSTVAEMEIDELSVAASGAIAEEQKRVSPLLAKGKNKAVVQSLLGSNYVVADIVATPAYKDVGRDKFEDFDINAFKIVAEKPVSTFSSDVDTASYSFIRRQLNNGVLPQKDAVRVEEMVNYFNYNYPVPASRTEPFQPTVTITDSPWAEGKKLMHIGIKAYQLEKAELRSNIVFLLDISGSMNAPDKLPLVKNSMKMLLGSLHPDDTVSIVTYAGATGVVLEPTKASQHRKIMNAMNNLRAGGGTAGAAGIKLAYDMAEQNFDKHSVNRVILATDGDFNVGITNREELQDFVERKRDKGIFLSVLGFGQGNYNDHMMQVLAQNGNGIAAYIDNLNEARKVLVQEATSSLFPIAKDVKFQVEFNPARVAEYRLIGYETRSLKREDFNNDKIDAGDMGAGHSVTAIYEFTPVGSEAVSVDALRYSNVKPEVKDRSDSSEYAFLKIRYKLPMESKSKLITLPVLETKKEMTQWAVEDTNFSTAVAAFGQILKGGQYTGDFSYDDVIALAQQGKGADKFGYRAEFINMVRLAKTYSR
ncbi:MAG: hypothetical protein COA45_11955 [Zetaproteobacteria bacterium]|nr:MAG: hypothetical protein COA45_11955 [Zetaproteobacteria bacterium]